MTNVSKSYRGLSVLLFITHFSLMFGPAIGFTIYGAKTLSATQVYLTVASIVASLIVFVIGLLFKRKTYAPIMIVLTALCLILQNYRTLMVVFTICLILDDLCIYPLWLDKHNKYKINREIDKRNELLEG